MNWQDIARSEIEDGLRSTGLWVTIGIFFLFLLVFGRLAGRGSFLTGGVLLDTNARTFAFFLTFLFVPIIGLVVSYTGLHRARARIDDFASARRATADEEGDSDAADVEDPTRAVFLGTVLGRVGLLAVAVFIALLPVILVLLAQSGTAAISEVFATFVGAILFGTLFVAIGLLISGVTSSRAQAAGGAVVAFLVIYAWPFVLEAIGLGLPFSVFEQVWVVFLYGNIEQTLFALRRGDLLASSSLGVLILAVVVAAALAISYHQFEQDETVLA